jgi:hypothetical protein
MTRDILDQEWDGPRYCSVPEWIILIQTMMTDDKNVTVQEHDDGIDCQYLNMRSLAIWEAQKAMKTGVSIRKNNNTFAWSGP